MVTTPSAAGESSGGVTPTQQRHGKPAERRLGRLCCSLVLCLSPVAVPFLAFAALCSPVAVVFWPFRLLRRAGVTLVRDPGRAFTRADGEVVVFCNFSPPALCFISCAIRLAQQGLLCACISCSNRTGSRSICVLCWSVFIVSTGNHTSTLRTRHWRWVVASRTVAQFVVVG